MPFTWPLFCPNTKTYKTYKHKVKEVEGAKGSAWFTDTKHNVFLDAGDNDFSPEHVRNRFIFFGQVWTIHILATKITSNKFSPRIIGLMKT